MNHYNNGRAFEYKVRDAFKADGYAVFRSAGSKTKVDLIAIKIGEIVFIQCKKTDGQISPDERDQLVSLAQLVQAVPLVASKPKPRKPIVFRRLTGTGPKDWIVWTPDEVTP